MKESEARVEMLKIFTSLDPNSSVYRRLVLSEQQIKSFFGQEKRRRVLLAAEAVASNVKLDLRMAASTDLDEGTAAEMCVYQIIITKLF